MTTQYDAAVADAERAYHAWTDGQRRKADDDFTWYQVAGGRASWPVWLARYRYDYEIPSGHMPWAVVADART